MTIARRKNLVTLKERFELAKRLIALNPDCTIKAMCKRASINQGTFSKMRLKEQRQSKVVSDAYETNESKQNATDKERE